MVIFELPTVCLSSFVLGRAHISLKYFKELLLLFFAFWFIRSHVPERARRLGENRSADSDHMVVPGEHGQK